MKKFVLSIIVITAVWYAIAYAINDYFVGNSLGVCICSPVRLVVLDNGKFVDVVSSDISSDINWPTFFPEGGCGDCGAPEPFSQFVTQLVIILFPAMIYSLYYARARKHKAV